MASATRSGSLGSSGAGRPVATLQKAQARVQTSPMIMKVACFCSQHSPMLGQAASWQTVERPLPSSSALVSRQSAEPGALTLIHAGLRRHGVVRPMRLLGMTLARLAQAARIVVEEIEGFGHGAPRGEATQ